MYLDIINKRNFVEKINEDVDIDSFDMQTHIINSYDINQIITWKEFLLYELEECFYDSKCPENCKNEIETIDHAYMHFSYLMELTLTCQTRMKMRMIFMNLNEDFLLQRYKLTFDGYFTILIQHISS